MKLSDALFRSAALCACITAIAIGSASAQSQFAAPLTTKPPATSAYVPPRAAPAEAVAAISRFHANLEIAEKGRDFASYKSAIDSTTTRDFNFNSLQHTSYNRDQYLKTKEALMKEATAASIATWKVVSTTPSSVDKSVDVTASRDVAETVTDTAGTFGAKGATHQITTHAEYWEHWVQATPGDSTSWKIDDMDTNKVTTLVDGKEWKPAPIGLTAAQIREQIREQKLLQKQQQQQQRRSRYPVTFTGGNNTTF